MKIEWRECHTHSEGYFNGHKVATYNMTTKLLIFCLSGYHQHDDLEKEAAKAKTEELLTEWLKSAELFHISEIVSCENCGDSGVSRGPKKGCDDSCPIETVCDGICVVDPDPCPCRQNPLSIWSIKNKEG